MIKQNVLITGASSGLGKEMAFAFSREGARVGLMARRKEELEKIVDEIKGFGGEALAIPVDLTNSEELEKSFMTFVNYFGSIDVLVNNAGAGIFGRKITEQDFIKLFMLNVHSVYKLSMLAHPYLKMVNGTIINIGSSVVERPFAGEFIYSASKGAVTTMTKTMAATWGPDGIRVNLIQPGIIKSGFNVSAGIPEDVDDSLYQNSQKLNALPSKGDADDVARAAVFLASPDSKFITGEVLKVDGGITLAGIRF